MSKAKSKKVVSQSVKRFVAIAYDTISNDYICSILSDSAKVTIQELDDDYDKSTLRVLEVELPRYKNAVPSVTPIKVKVI